VFGGSVIGSVFKAYAILFFPLRMGCVGLLEITQNLVRMGLTLQFSSPGLAVLF
jgi:hypothetical protein